MFIKKCVLAAGLAATLITVPLTFAITEVLDQVVAIVDDDIIMASELRERLATVTESMRAREIEPPAEDVLIRETLDRLILESIQLQMGEQVGVRIADTQLNAAMQRMASQNRMTLDQFRMALDQQGQSYAVMRDQIRREMTIQRVQGGNVNNRIQITDQEVDNFIATEEGQKLVQPEYRIVQALLAVSPDAPDSEVEAAEAYIDRMLARIQDGDPFQEVVAQADSYPLSGGDLGWRKLDDLPSIFNDIAPTLTRGETGKVRSPSGFHLVYMVENRGGEQMVSETEVRHILVKPSEIMTEAQAETLVTELKRRAEAGEDFAELAKEYSEDIGSAQEGGELGWTTSGQMVPVFEDTMASTDIDTVSPAFKSQYGWHILEVTGRREQDMSEQLGRNQAMEYLHNRKYQEELDAWLQKIRDEAFVDIK
ncbi:MAG: peptidyl-prolyl cis-trans isomerase SurA [Alcanivorax sp.]